MGGGGGNVRWGAILLQRRRVAVLLQRWRIIVLLHAVWYVFVS